MMRTRTRMVSAEPDPLAAVGRHTTISLGSVDRMIEAIDGVLQLPAEVSSLWPFDEHSTLRTRLRDEPQPLRIPVHLPAAVRVATRSLPPRAMQLDRSLNEIRRWLGVGLRGACSAAGINRGTVYAWRERESEPRPATVSSVLRLHGLIKSVINAVGEERARAWFHAGAPSPVDRLMSAAGDPGVLSDISREARRRLTGPTIPPPNPLLTATIDDAPSHSLA
jgi:hypothetical protein